jgi:hypothetical protein
MVRKVATHRMPDPPGQRTLVQLPQRHRRPSHALYSVSNSSKFDLHATTHLEQEQQQ